MLLFIVIAGIIAVLLLAIVSDRRTFTRANAVQLCEDGILPPPRDKEWDWPLAPDLSHRRGISHLSRGDAVDFKKYLAEK